MNHFENSLPEPHGQHRFMLPCSVWIALESLDSEWPCEQTWAHLCTYEGSRFLIRISYMTATDIYLESGLLVDYALAGFPVSAAWTRLEDGMDANVSSRNPQ